MNDSIRENWERFLNPESLRGNLILASLYIAAFEILKNSIVGRIKDFYWIGFDENGDIIDTRYQTEVLERNRSPLYASLEWLKESNVISDDDISLFNGVKEYRNAIAHEIARMLSEGLPSDFPERFNEMVYLLNIIELWWVINVEIPINPDLADKEIEEDDIVPGPVASLQMMVNIALGSDEEARAYYDEFVKLSRGA